MNRRNLTTLLVAVFLTQACKCQTDPLGGVAPDIVASPNPVAFERAPVGAESLVRLVVRNDGNTTLNLADVPVLAEGDEDTEVELVLRAAGVPIDCADGTERTDPTPLSLEPGQCVGAEVVYTPLNLGPDTGTITIASDDPDTPSLVIPIQALGAAPDISVCVLPGDCAAATACNDEGPLTMAFPVAQIDSTTRCEVRVENAGELPLKRLEWAFANGNRRRYFALDPADLSTMGDLAPEAGVTLGVTFTPRSGGPRVGTIEVNSSDPDEGAVFIELTGSADGPQLCPDPFPTVDFGQVEVGTTVSQDVTLGNCGNVDMDVTALETQDATGAGPSAEFALGAGTPALPIPVAAGGDAPVPVTFSPVAPGPVTGRLYLESTDPAVPSGWVNLVGEGIVPPSCELQASVSTLSMGQAAPTSAGGTPVVKTLALSNPGRLACTGVTASITAGAGVRFTLVGFPAGGPPWTLQPGDIVVFSVEYDPADTTGPDQGTLSFTANELAAGLDVQLTGSPVAAPTCDLVVNPGVGNFQFNECGTLSFTPRVAQFGAVKLPQTKLLPVSLENRGSIACTVNAVSLQPLPFTGLDPTFTLSTGANRVRVNGVLTNRIQPGEIGEAVVQYEPTSETLNCGALWIETSNVAHQSECQGFGGGAPDGCYQVSLLGRGVRSAIEVIPGDVDFGLITVGCASPERSVTIYNIGGAPMTITSIYLDPATSPFTLVSVPPMPQTLASGGQVGVRVKYRPPDANTHSALLVIESDAQNLPFMTVPLTGQGTTDTHQIDTFQQLSEPKVDVLWVIDDSCSMSEEQQNIANNTGTFLSRALTLNTDFQIGVVTTDMDDGAKSGRLQSRNGAPKIITRATADPVGAFQNNARQGTGGSGSEKGLAGAHAALSDPLINDPAANLGFLRDDAKLVIINVSDDDDHANPTTDFYVDFFRNIKGYRNADLMSFSAVVSPSPVCSGAAAPGDRYMDVANRTGGLIRSICSTDWGRIADDLGLDTFGSKSQFFLTREAIEATIVVRVDNVNVPRAGNWSYETASNSVVFDPTVAPGPGATIVVEYDTVCR